VGYALSLAVDQELLALNRAVGELRRRNLPISSIAVAPGERPGEARVTVFVDADLATAETAVKKLHKLSGVRGASHFVVPEGRTRELALCRVRVTPARDAALHELCARFHATVVDERPDERTVELAGDASVVLVFVRALEPFGILELVRSGPIALARAPTGEPVAPPRAP
jgi:acetolactate synthase I/III small subunit